MTPCASSLKLSATPTVHACIVAQKKRSGTQKMRDAHCKPSNKALHPMQPPRRQPAAKACVHIQAGHEIAPRGLPHAVPTSVVSTGDSGRHSSAAGGSGTDRRDHTAAAHETPESMPMQAAGCCICVCMSSAESSQTDIRHTHRASLDAGRCVCGSAPRARAPHARCASLERGRRSRRRRPEALNLRGDVDQLRLRGAARAARERGATGWRRGAARARRREAGCAHRSAARTDIIRDTVYAYAAPTKPTSPPASRTLRTSGDGPPAAPGAGPNTRTLASARAARRMSNVHRQWHGTRQLQRDVCRGRA